MLNIRKQGVYLDATAGGGGHSMEILSRLSEQGRLICTDRDEFAIQRLREVFHDDRISIRQARFSELNDTVASLGFSRLDGILFDLGVSAFQLKQEDRGFSFDSDAPLDMRMDKENTLTARHIVNEYPQDEIADILWKYADERFSRRIARAIVREREKKEISTCRELAAIIARVYGRRGKIHPATRTFQALRIAVNHEMEELTAGLGHAERLLNKGGRLCVISYHSLEDRTVKHFLRDRAREEVFMTLTRKPVVPAEDEERRNPSSRSAKLRGAERL